MTYYIDGETQHLQLDPNDSLINETFENGEKTLNDKLGRWSHLKPDKIVVDYGNGTMIVEDGSSRRLMWLCKDKDGFDVKTDYSSLQNTQNRTFCMKKVPISDQNFREHDAPGNSSYSQINETGQPVQQRITIDGNRMMHIPDDFKRQYATDDPFFVNFSTLDEGWDKYKTVAGDKTLTYGWEIQEAFASEFRSIEYAYRKNSAPGEMLYRYDNYSVEPDSYWVDKKVGMLATHIYEAKPCKEMPRLRSSHFKEDVKEYVEKTLKPVWYWSNYDNLAMTTERSVVESARITMIPMSENVWIVLVASGFGNGGRITGFWTFSVIQFDSPKPILRFWGQKTFGITGTFGTQGFTTIDPEWADPEKDLELYGVGDVNLDGFKDFIFRYNGWGSATQDSHSIMIITLTDKGFAEIATDSWRLYDFYGFDGNRPLFQYLHFGTGQMYSTYRNESLASTRWNRHILKVVEPRKDGFLYMVSYRYNRNIEDKLNAIAKNDITYLSLGEYEVIGQAKIAQKAFLETTTYSTQEQKEIVKVLISKCKTMFVQSSEELLPELKKHDPY